MYLLMYYGRTRAAVSALFMSRDRLLNRPGNLLQRFASVFPSLLLT